MSNPIGALIAAFGGGVEGMDAYTQKKHASDRADADELRKQALEELAMQEALGRMGAHAGAPPPQAPDASLAPSVQAPMAAPSERAMQALTGSSSLAPQGAQQPGPIANGGGTMDAIAQLAQSAPPKAPLPKPSTGPQQYEQFNLRGLKGEQKPYYVDPNDTHEAQVIRQQAAAQEQMAKRQQQNEQLKLDYAHTREKSAWAGDFDSLKRVKYFGPEVQFNPEHNYSTDWQDYLARTKGAEASDRTDARIAGALHGVGAMGQQQREQDANDAAEGWFRGVIAAPTRDGIAAQKMYVDIAKGHPTWAPPRIMRAVQTGMKLGAQGDNIEARTASTQAGTAGKNATTKLMDSTYTPQQAPAPYDKTGAPPAPAGAAPLNMGPVGAGARPATPQATAAPTPEFAMRAKALQAQGLSRTAIAAQLSHEGWDLNTGQKGAPR